MVWLLFPSAKVTGVSMFQQVRLRCINLQVLPIFCNCSGRNTAFSLHDLSNTFRDIGRTRLRLWSFLGRDDEVRNYVSSNLIICLNESSIKAEE